MEAGILVLFVLAAGAAAYAASVFKRKRREEFVSLAGRLGLAHSLGDPFAIDDRMSHRLFSLGEGRGCENVMWGMWQGMPVTQFDYWYYTESTDSEGHTSRSYHRFSCVLTSVPADCPPISISKENLFTRMADGLGFRDIEFESEDFNRSWQVRCADRKFANDLIDQRMMQWLMYAGTGWSFEIVGQIALVSSGKLKIADLPGLLACAKAFREKLPRVVADLYPIAGPAQSVPGV